MSTKYAAVSKRALATIRRKGAPVTFEGVATAPSYDEDTGVHTPGVPQTIHGVAVQTDTNPERLAALSLKVVRPVTLLIAATFTNDAGAAVAFAPEVGKTMNWAGQPFAIVDVDAVAPDGEPIVFTVMGSR